MPKTISFVRGFRIPKEEDIDQALGSNSSFSNQFKTSFDSLPIPTNESDWLANYREKGQTYAQFLDDCPFLDDGNPSQKYIYITLLDNDDHLSLLNIDHLIDYTQRFFQMTVKLIPLFTNIIWNKEKRTWRCTTKDRRGSAKENILRTRYDSSSGHSQICVDAVLNLLKRSVPSDARCLVAITLHDFYSDPSDLFIAGLAQGNCRVAAFSFFRYDPRLSFADEFWYDWKMKTTKSVSMKNIILLRSCRLLTHEIGHLLGIDHCIYYGCLMNGSGHIEEDFSQPLFLCPIDLRKLSQLSEFDLIQRYEQLLEFCTENQFENEMDILKKRLEILKNEKKTIQTKKNKNLLEDDDEQKKKTKHKVSITLSSRIVRRFFIPSTPQFRRSSNFVRIFEVGPRHGLQNEKVQVPKSIKVEFIDRLSRTGLKCIEVTSFVSPKWVPQMSDHVEVLAAIDRIPGVCYSALTPNVHSINKVLSLGTKGVDEVAILSAASETFSKKNINCSIERSLRRFDEVAKIAHEKNLPLRVSISCAVGCPYEGKITPSQVVPLVEKLLEMHCYEVALADTIGVGTPKSIQELIQAINASDVPSYKLAIHCHDTYGQAVANIAQALEVGIRCVDSSVAGLDRLIDVSQLITNVLKRVNMSKVIRATLSKREN